ncbi:MAG: DHHA1 domain-containing protein [Fimbriimonadales bacterium]|nr:DHHA1 domain-containing protein [Fimbriimonadales bacterium]
MLLREAPNRKIRVSLRSRGALNVAVIAQQFGGGGHENAAGCTLEMSMSDAEQALLQEVQKWMACSTSTNPSA